MNNLEKAAEIVTRCTRDWTPADWEGETQEVLIQEAKKMLDENPGLLYGNMLGAQYAFEHYMGWA